jgi:hypothetical protein
LWQRRRTTVDLSHGWGHNSQWSTDFRGDYIAEGHLYFNVDANPTRQPDKRLDDADRLDLLRYRCSIRTDFGADQSPFDYTYVALRPGATTVSWCRLPPTRPLASHHRPSFDHYDAHSRPRQVISSKRSQLPLPIKTNGSTGWSASLGSCCSESSRSVLLGKLADDRVVGGVDGLAKFIVGDRTTDG